MNKLDINFVVNELDYTWSKRLQKFFVTIPDNIPKREIYGMLYDLKYNILDGKGLFTIGELSMFKNHCKFYKRLGNRVIYELILRRH